MRLVLDTSAFFVAGALRALRESSVDAILPAVAFAERARQLSREGRMAPEEFEGWLAANHIVVEPFGATEALRYAVRVRDPLLWRRAGRDAMIAGHVGPEDVLWTSNRRDFEAVGLPRGRMREPGTFP